VRLAGHRFAVKKAQVLLPAKCRCSSGHRCCVERGPTRANRGAILDVARAHDGGTHLGFRSNAPPFAGRCGTRRPQRWGAPLTRSESSGASAEHERVHLSKRHSYDERGARYSARGGSSPAQTTARTFTRWSPVHAGGLLLRKLVPRAGSSARAAPPARSADGKGRRPGEVVTSSRRTRSRRRSR